MSDAGSAFRGSLAGSWGPDRGPSLRVGQRVFQKFVLQKLLGRGAMGIVWLAKDEEMRLGRALKFLPSVFARDDSAFQQIQREAANCIGLAHPHIVRVYDPLRDDQMAAIPMEYVDGQNLSALLRSRSRAFFEPDEIAEWVRQLCEALHYAHSDAHPTVVHRDLKPANLMVNSKDQLKLTDFGLASRLAASRALPTEGQVGTLDYMSPQQMCGAQPTHQDDIYSLGATLYELLTSKPPFYSGDLHHQIQNIRPALISERRAQLGLQGEPIPREWEEVIQACLEKSPARRPDSAREVAERLARRDIGDPPPYKLEITDHPRDVKVVAGQSATFSVHAEGAPAPSYQWQHDGVDIHGTHSPSYTIDNVQPSHSGAYACRVSNELGSAVSLEARLTVRAPAPPVGKPPQIQVHPADAEARIGERVVFSVSATGTPTPIYQWCKDGADIPGASQASYEIRSVRADDVGDYSVRVQNNYSTEISQIARLSVLQHPSPPPSTSTPPRQRLTIKEHPQDLIIQRGGNAKFTVIADGTQPLRYQWRHDGEDIRGATRSILLLREVRHEETGEYTVEVSNDAGSVTSEPATLSLKGTGKRRHNPLVLVGVPLGVLALGLIGFGVWKNPPWKKVPPVVVHSGTNTPPVTNTPPPQRTGLIISAGKQAVSYTSPSQGSGNLDPGKMITNQLSAGSHTVTFSRIPVSRDFPFTHTSTQLRVDVRSGELASVKAPDFPEGSLDIQSNPPGLPFQLNDSGSAQAVIGNTPAKYANLPTGSYRVTFTQAGVTPYITNITIVPDKEVAVSWTAPIPPKYGGFTITTVPPGATASIDGVLLPPKTTPATFASLTPRDYKVTFTMNGYRPSTTNVQVKAGQPTDYGTVVLTRDTPPGRLTISVFPAGAQVKVVDGTVELAVAHPFTNDFPRQVKVSAELTGYVPQATNLLVGAGLNPSVVWQLQKIPVLPRIGLLNLTVNPSNAEVEVDGKTETRRSLSFSNESPQRLTLTAKLVGYEDRTTNVMVGAGLTNHLFLALNVRPNPKPMVQPPTRDTRQWKNSLGMEFVAVPGVVGLMCTHETRVQDFQDFAKEKELSWSPPDSSRSPGNHPAVTIEWKFANDFCAWLTEKEKTAGLISGAQRYRLPTDREWSAAVGLTNEDGDKPIDRSKKASAGSSSGKLFAVPEWDAPWGRIKATDRPPRGAGNYAASVGVDDYPNTAPVKSFSPNQYGLYDLGGNVWEWCEELFDASPGVHPLRGGSWKTELRLDARPYAHFMLSGMRFPGSIGLDDTGFRVVLDLGR